MNRLLIGLTLLLLAVPACDKKETPAASTATPGSTGAAPVASAKAAEEGEGMAIEEDFEDEAEEKITAQNADEELDKLEKEISQ